MRANDRSWEEKKQGETEQGTLSEASVYQGNLIYLKHMSAGTPLSGTIRGQCSPYDIV